MTDESYEEQGYFIRTPAYWYELYPTICLVNYDTDIITHKPIGYEFVEKVPLSWRKVA